MDSMTLESYSLGKRASPSLCRTESPLQLPQCFRYSSYPFSPESYPGYHQFQTPTSRCAGTVSTSPPNQRTHEPDAAEFTHADSHFPSCCPSSFSLNSEPMYDVLFCHLKMLQLNTCMVTMATIRQQRLVPEAETASKKANTVVYCFFLD